MSQSEYKEAFQTFDHDGDGKLNAEEFGNALRTLGNNPTEHEIQQMMSEVHGGLISFSEFLNMKQRVSQTNRDEEIRESYRAFDKDGNGLLSAAELKFVMTTMGEKMTEQEFEELLKGIFIFLSFFFKKKNKPTK